MQTFEIMPVHIYTSFALLFHPKQHFCTKGKFNTYTSAYGGKYVQDINNSNSAPSFSSVYSVHIAMPLG